MGLSSGANPLVWRRSRLPRGSGRAIKNPENWPKATPRRVIGLETPKTGQNFISYMHSTVLFVCSSLMLIVVSWNGSGAQWGLPDRQGSSVWGSLGRHFLERFSTFLMARPLQRGSRLRRHTDGFAPLDKLLPAGNGAKGPEVYFRVPSIQKEHPCGL